MLVAIAGLMGSGKTSISKRLEKVGYITLHRDEFITFMFDPVEYSSREQKNIAEQAMLSIAEYYLKQNRNVLLDMQFSYKKHVDAAQLVAEKTSSKFKLLYCKCPDEVAIERIQSEKHVATDRTREVYFEQKSRFEQFQIPYKIVNTDRSLDETIKACILYLEED